MSDMLKANPTPQPLPPSVPPLSGGRNSEASERGSAPRRWYYMFIFANISNLNPKSNVESPFHFGCFGSRRARRHSPRTLTFGKGRGWGRKILSCPQHCKGEE